MNPYAASKEALRAQMTARLSALPLALFSGAGEAVAARLALLPAFSCASTVAVFISIKHEIDTAPVIAHCTRERKTILLPACCREQSRYEFCLYTEGEPLERGPHGALEPVSKHRTARPDLILVPGLAFDRAGHRLGRGGGVYDDLLARYPAYSIALGLEIQMTDRVPAEPHDRRVDAILTEASHRLCGATVEQFYKPT